VVDRLVRASVPGKRCRFEVLPRTRSRIDCNGSRKVRTCQVLLVPESFSSCICTFQTLIEPFPSFIDSISFFIEPFPSFIGSVSSLIEQVLIEIESSILFIGSFLPEHGSIIVDKVQRILANGSIQAGHGSRFTCRASFQVAPGAIQTCTEPPQDGNGSILVCIVSVEEETEQACTIVVSRHKIHAPLLASDAHLPVEKTPVLARNASFRPGEEKSIAKQGDGHSVIESAPSFESAALSRASRQQTRAVGSDGFELQSCAVLGASFAPPQPGPGLQVPPAAVQPFPELDDDPHATPTMARRSASAAEPVLRRRGIAP
jgi:hypothetical protein